VLERAWRFESSHPHHWRAGSLPSSYRGNDPLLEECETCGKLAHRFAELPNEYVYLLGLYLGDGCISPHERGVYKLRISLDAKYPGIVGECSSALAAVMPESKVNTYTRSTNVVEVFSYSKAWPCLLPQQDRSKAQTPHPVG
jgi:hypothetical protein